MKVRKIAIVCTMIGVMLFGASAAVFAQSSYFAKSENNHFSALVGAGEESGLLLSDSDEDWAAVIHDTFYGKDLTPYGDLEPVGDMSIWNTSANEVDVKFSFSEEDEDMTSSIAYDFEVLIIKRTNGVSEVLFGGKLAELVSVNIDTLEAGAQENYEMYAGTTRLFSPDEVDTSIDFSIDIEGVPVYEQGTIQ